MRQWWGRLMKCVAVPMASLLLLSAARPVTAQEPAAAPAANGAIPLRVGPDTTRLTAPLHPDGTVHFLAALDRELAQGVTTLNNAAVPMLRATGVEAPPAIREPILNGLGIAPPPDDEVFINLRRFVVERQRQTHPRITDDELKQAVMAAESDLATVRQRPWRSDDHPLLAQWLEHNKPPLDALVHAVQRPRFYVPLESGQQPQTLSQVVLPHLTTLQHVSRALSARSMQRLASGYVEGALRDTLAIYRTARLVRQQRLLPSHLVSLALDAWAVEDTLLIAQHGRLSRAHAQRMIAELRALPRRAPAGDCLDSGERYAVLDLVQSLHRDGTGRALADVLGSAEPTLVERLAPLRELPLLADYDAVLVHLNTSFDRVLAAWNEPDPTRGHDLVVQIESELRGAGEQAVARLIDPAFIAQYRAAPADEQRTLMTAVVQAIGGRLVAPALAVRFRTEHHLAMKMRLAEAALALAAFYADRGEFPVRLEDLAPGYLPTVPMDMFIERPLVYRRDEQGCIIYSVGLNRIDEYGNPNDLRDVVVRLVPLRARE